MLIDEYLCLLIFFFNLLIDIVIILVVRLEKIEILLLNFIVEFYFYGIIEYLVYIGIDICYIVGLIDKIKIVIC